MYSKLTPYVQLSAVIARHNEIAVATNVQSLSSMKRNFVERFTIIGQCTGWSEDESVATMKRVSKVSCTIAGHALERD